MSPPCTRGPASIAQTSSRSSTSTQAPRTTRRSSTGPTAPDPTAGTKLVKIVGFFSRRGGSSSPVGPDDAGALARESTNCVTSPCNPRVPELPSTDSAGVTSDDRDLTDIFPRSRIECNAHDVRRRVAARADESARERSDHPRLEVRALSIQRTPGFLKRGRSERPPFFIA